MILFHGRRTATGSNGEAEIDLNIKKYGEPGRGHCVIEISGRIAGDFAEYHSYIRYNTYCEYMVSKGQIDDRTLNPDDLVNRILPRLSFRLEPTDVNGRSVGEVGGAVGGEGNVQASDEQKCGTKQWQRVVILFEGLAPDSDMWQFESASNVHSDGIATSNISYTYLRPIEIDTIDNGR